MDTATDQQLQEYGAMEFVAHTRAWAEWARYQLTASEELRALWTKMDQLDRRISRTQNPKEALALLWEFDGVYEKALERDTLSSLAQAKISSQLDEWLREARLQAFGSDSIPTTTPTTAKD